MAKLFNRAKMTTATTGSGTVTLGSASNGFQTFAAAGVSNGDVVQYVIEEGANFEIGTGTYSSSGTSLTRSPTESSNSNSAITLAGQATVSITAVADDLNRLQHGGSDKVTVSSTGASVTGNLAVSGTVDGVDISARDAVLTTTTTTANAALPKAGGTMTGHLGIGGTATDASWSDATYGNTEVSIDGGGGYGVLHFRGDGAGSSDTRYSVGVGDGIFYMAYDDVDGVHRAKINASHQLIVNETSGGSGEKRVFHDGYHPNADAWTTSRTLSLSGDASGSVSWSGSANATLSVTVANDSHTHDGRYFTETESDSRFVRKGVGYTWTATGSNKLSFRSENTIDTASGNQAALEIYQDTVGADAFMQFHVGGDYAKYFGLHGGINDFVVGGWSHGASYQRVFHDGYHPNADTLTTARTINGVSFNGSANITVADSTKLPLSGGTITGDLNVNGVRFRVGSNVARNLKIQPTGSDSTVGLTMFNGAGAHCIQLYGGSTEYGFLDANWGGWDIQKSKNGAFKVDEGSGLQRVFNDAYHPNADKWTTARTLSLTGDVTGSVSWDGSGNASLSTTVGNDSHTHSNYITSNADDNVSAHTEWQDDKNIRLGTGADFRMWFDGSHTYFRNYAHAGGNIYFQGEDTEGSNHALLYMDNGSSAPFLRLYQNGDERLRTLSGGVGVTGLTVGDVDANPHNAGGLFISMSATDEKIVLSGSSNPYIRFQELTTDKAYIRWQTDGFLAFNNQESGNFRFRSHSATQPVNVRLEASDGDLYGSIYGSHSNEIGFLDDQSDWTYRIARDSLHEWRINNVVEMSLSTSTLDMKNNAIDNVNQINIGAAVYLSESTDRADLLQITSATSSWGGLQIRNSSNEGRWSFMTNGAEAGIYDDENNKWAIHFTELGATQFYYGGIEKATIGSTYFELSQHLDLNNYDIYGCDQIFHHGDTNTYMQFHAADQWRVVVGGSERLEVKNSSPHVLVSGDLNSTSDERLKKNIKPIDNALADICQLEGVTFDWKDTGTQGQGFIAQQVEPIIPDVVNTDEDTGMKSINYVGLIGHLVEAIKTQQTQINDLKAEIQSMKS